MVVDDSYRVHGRRQARSVGENANFFTGQFRRGQRHKVGGQSTVHGRGVHVADPRRQQQGRLGHPFEHVLTAFHERLLDVPVKVCVGQNDIPVLFQTGIVFVFRVTVDEVVEVEASQRLLHQFAVRRVEHERVELVQVQTTAVGGFARVRLVALVKSVQIALDREFSVHNRVLGRQVGLEEIVRVVHVRASETPLNHQRSVGADEHGDGAGTAGRTSVALGVDRDVGGDHNSQPAVPRTRLDPG